MDWLPAIATASVLFVIFGVGAAAMVSKKPNILPKLFTSLVVALVVSLLIYAASLMLFGDGSEAFRVVWSWFERGGATAKRLATMWLT